MIEYEITRYNQGIDPHLHIWGWEIPIYLFLGGLAAGLMIWTALLGLRDEENSPWLRWAPFFAPVALSIGMGALFLDLAFKLHVYRFYLSFEWSSPMSWGSWILLLVYPASLGLGFAGLNQAELAKLEALNPIKRLNPLLRQISLRSKEQLQLLRWANIILGAALGGYTGILLGSLGARALWNSSILAPLFLSSGLSAGAALLMLLPIRDGEHSFLRRGDIFIIFIELVLLFLYISGLVTGGGESGQKAAGLILGGSYTAPFWSLVVFMGLMIPLFMEVLEGRKSLKPNLVAPSLLLLGGLALRWIMVSAGQA